MVEKRTVRKSKAKKADNQEVIPLPHPHLVIVPKPKPAPPKEKGQAE